MGPNLFGGLLVGCIGHAPVLWGGVFLCDLGQLATKSLRDGGSRGVVSCGFLGGISSVHARSMMFFNSVMGTNVVVS